MASRTTRTKAKARTRTSLDDLIDRKDAAEIIGISGNAMTSAVQRGDVPARPNTKKVRRGDVLDFKVRREGRDVKEVKEEAKDSGAKRKQCADKAKVEASIYKTKTALSGLVDSVVAAEDVRATSDTRRPPWPRSRRGPSSALLSGWRTEGAKTSRSCVTSSSGGTAWPRLLDSPSKPIAGADSPRLTALVDAWCWSGKCISTLLGHPFLSRISNRKFEAISDA